MLPQCQRIIYHIEELVNKLMTQRAQNKSIVFTNGCYDILHPGHVYVLQKAKALGDILVVALNTDASVRRQNKGRERPIVPLEARAFVIAHLGSVDYVTAFDDDTPYALIEQIQPDVLVKGGDWSTSAIVGADIVEKRGGSVYSIPIVEGYSTTAIVQKIQQSIL